MVTGDLFNYVDKCRSVVCRSEVYISVCFSAFDLFIPKDLYGQSLRGRKIVSSRGETSFARVARKERTFSSVRKLFKTPGRERVDREESGRTRARYLFTSKWNFPTFPKLIPQVKEISPSSPGHGRSQ